jgi:hypothetical protein
LPGSSGPRGTAGIARSAFGRIRARQQPDSKRFGEPNSRFKRRQLMIPEMSN